MFGKWFGKKEEEKPQVLVREGIKTGLASVGGAESARGGGKCFWIIMQSITILFKKKKKIHIVQLVV